MNYISRLGTQTSVVLHSTYQKSADKCIVLYDRVLPMRRIATGMLAALILLSVEQTANAQQIDSLVSTPDFSVDNLSDAEIDAIDVNRKLKINDYSMIGVQYGVNMSQVYWTPSYQQRLKFLPYNVGIVFTRYGKMFGYMPYFGFQVGVFYGQEGYSFKNDVKSGEEKKYYTTYLNSKSAVLNVIEVPVLAHFHIDFWKMKVMLNVGFFGGYRLSIDREEDTDEYNSSGGFEPEYAHSFASFEKRLDYGLKGGAGFAFMFDPVEIHFSATYKHSFSSLCSPDYYSQYFYRYAYPMNITVSVGLRFQLTKRSGRTKHELKREAKTMVFGADKIDKVSDTGKGDNAAGKMEEFGDGNPSLNVPNADVTEMNDVESIVGKD